MAATIESQISRIESQIFSLQSQIETVKNIDGRIDEEMKRIFKSIYLDLKNKLDILESMKKANLGITSDKKFNKLLYQKNEEEQCQSRGKKGKVILKKVTGKKFKKVKGYLSHCPGCKICATLNETEKSFLTQYCKIFKSIK